jgi:hypothetical protein
VRDVEVQGLREYDGLSQEEKQITLDTDMKIATNIYLRDLKTDPQNVNNLQDLIEFTKKLRRGGAPRSKCSGP